MGTIDVQQSSDLLALQTMASEFRIGRTVELAVPYRSYTVGVTWPAFAVTEAPKLRRSIVIKPHTFHVGEDGHQHVTTPTSPSFHSIRGETSVDTKDPMQDISRLSSALRTRLLPWTGNGRARLLAHYFDLYGNYHAALGISVPGSWLTWILQTGKHFLRPVDPKMVSPRI